MAEERSRARNLGLRSTEDAQKYQTDYSTILDRYNGLLVEHEQQKEELRRLR